MREDGQGTHATTARPAIASQLHRVLEEIPAAAYTCDAEGRITYYNRRASNVWGRQPTLNDPVDRYCGAFRLFTADGAPLAHDRCLMALALRDQLALDEQEIIVERPDGSRITVLANVNLLRDESGVVTGAVNILVDINDRKRAEEGISEARQFFHSSIDALSSHIAILDEHAIVLAVNDAWRRFADANQYAGHNYGIGASYITACEPTSSGYLDGASVAAGLDDVLKGRRNLFELEYPCHSPNEDRWFVLRMTRFKPPGPVRVVVAHENITSRKKADEALRDADRRKDEFLATLAHELRNPLAPISNSLQILRLTKDDAAAVEQARSVMERQLKQMVRLVDDLLDVSRINQGKLELRLERVDLASLMRHAVETSRPVIDAGGHEIMILLPPEPVFVDADVIRLGQVFANLLNNAAKYSERGGRIRMTAERRGVEVVVCVADSGVGIPIDMLPKIFDLFMQVDRSLEKSQGGLGIGLTLVRRLVEMHGGSVEAHSEGLGRGSEFVVRLPTALATVSEVEPPSGQAAALQPPTRRRILVADDNVDSATSLTMLLEIMGNEVRTAYNGMEALDVAAAFRPDLILLDIGMPDLNGYEACRRIRDQPWGKATVLIALTGWGQDEDKRLSQEAGFNHHMVKPVDLAHIEKLLAELSPMSV